MSEIQTYKMLIGGEWFNASNGATINVENPANEEIIATIPAGTAEDAQKALEAAQAAQPAWAALSPVQRANHLRNFCKVIDENKEHLAKILSAEQGKIYEQALGEVGGTINFLMFAAENGRRIEGDIFPSDNPNEQIWIQRVPYGVTVGLVAWNFPIALAARKAGPALVTGNTMVIKPHEDTSLAVIEFGRLALEAGIPAGVLNVVTGRGREIGEALVKSPITKLVTLTGSTRAGTEIFRAAADNITALRLELGGKAPFIVLEDADLEKAVKAALDSRFVNCGQVCTCNDRIYVHESIYDKFLAKLVHGVSQLTVGDAFSGADIGPKVNKPEVERLQGLVKDALDHGAKAAIGGHRLQEGKFAKGHWFEPTVLVETDHSMRIMKEEIFGPVMAVQPIKSFDEALVLANDSEYGLSAYIFTEDLKTIMRVVNELEFGEVYINRGMGEQLQGFHNGFKKSGIGGEDGKYGLENYLQKKTVYVNYG